MCIRDFVIIGFNRRFPSIFQRAPIIRIGYRKPISTLAMRRPFLSLLFFSYQEDPNAPLINSVIILRCINARAFSILTNELC